MIPINSNPTRVARDLALWRSGRFAAGSPKLIRTWRTRRLLRAVSRNNRHDIERRMATQADHRPKREHRLSRRARAGVSPT